MADSELSEFDAKARAVVLLLRAGVEKVLAADDEVRDLLELLGRDDDEDPDVLSTAMSEAIDKIEGGIQDALGALTVVIGRRHLAALVADELAAHEAAKGPADIRDRPTPG